MIPGTRLQQGSTTSGMWRELAREHNLAPRRDVSATRQRATATGVTMTRHYLGFPGKRMWLLMR